VSRRLLPLVFVAILAASAACQAAATSAPSAAPSAAASPAAAALSVTGLVATPLALSEADLHAMDVATITADQPKVGSASFQGVRLSVLFGKAGISADAKTATLTGADGFASDVALSDIASCADCMVAFGATPGHLLSVMPGMSGKAWVKDLVSIALK
jgi:DMSO/TMAO reductase YedYZ molybdopterin-dependent catalytic subunit